MPTVLCIKQLNIPAYPIPLKHIPMKSLLNNCDVRREKVPLHCIITLWESQKQHENDILTDFFILPKYYLVFDKCSLLVLERNYLSLASKANLVQLLLSVVLYGGGCNVKASIKYFKLPFNSILPSYQKILIIIVFV